MVYGYDSALAKGHLHYCDGSNNTENDNVILERHILPSSHHLFQG